MKTTTGSFFFLDDLTPLLAIPVLQGIHSALYGCQCLNEADVGCRVASTKTSLLHFSITDIVVGVVLSRTRQLAVNDASIAFHVSFILASLVVAGSR